MTATLPLYPPTLISATALARERIRVVLGGPWMGTTTILAAIQERLGLTRAVSARQDPEAARRVIAEWSQGRHPAICVGNVDVIVGELEVQKQLIAAEHGFAVLGGFFSIDRVRHQYRTEATGIPGTLAPTDLWWQKSYKVHLNPWGYPGRTDWQEQQTAVVVDHLTKDLLHLRKSRGRLPRALAATARTLAATLVRVGGGHPSLVGRGYQVLFGWLAADSPELYTPEESLTSALHNEAFDTFLDAATVVLREMPDEFAALLALAANPGTIRSATLHNGDLLRASGLVREVRDQSSMGWDFVHDRAAPAILHVAERRGLPTATLAPHGRAPLPRLRVRPDARQPELSGAIERADDASTILWLTDTQWQLLKALADQRGSPVTVDRLATLIQKKKTAVNPGLQRLREKLRSVGLEELVYNCDGSGYALDARVVQVD